ncbi:TonB C-terminal domain-containing protein [Chitinibacter tainanensis]|uniref:TonB C-terminal domain-containing protein n=1 Tax=Chitinibacter tainanensis TaxID=230667 RepID=UPI0004123E40|nr:TonB C-terminal domain-containing protein [Chitinibacter tainanensis]
MSPVHNPAHAEQRGLAFVLAVLMHVLLAGVLLLSVQWKTKPAQPVQVELWGGPPPAAPAEPPVEPVNAKPVKQPPPEPEVVPEKVDIQTAQVKTTPKPTAKPTATPLLTPKPTPTPKATVEPKATAVPAKATPQPKAKPTAAPKKSSELQDALSFDNVVASNKSDSKPVAGGKAGGTGTNPNATGNSGPGKGSGNNLSGIESYKGRLIQQIKSRTVYSKGGNPTAEFRVIVLPDGSILEDQLQQLNATGDPAYAEATKRAILSMGRFPPLPDGQTFSGPLRTWTIKFRLD